MSTGRPVRWLLSSLVPGWVHQVGDPDPVGGYATVLVASRRPLTPVGPTYPDDFYGHRFVHVEVRGSGWSIVGALIPGHNSRKPERKRQAWSFVVNQLAEAAKDQPTLLIGDLNTGLHHIDEDGATLRCADEMAALFGAGWTGAWRQLDPGPPPSTWWSPAGNGFRLDHALLSPASPAPIAAEYLSEINGERTTRSGEPKQPGEEHSPLSDHVPIMVDLPVSA